MEQAYQQAYYRHTFKKTNSVITGIPQAYFFRIFKIRVNTRNDIKTRKNMDFFVELAGQMQQKSLFI